MQPRLEKEIFWIIQPDKITLTQQSVMNLPNCFDLCKICKVLMYVLCH